MYSTSSIPGRRGRADAAQNFEKYLWVLPGNPTGYVGAVYFMAASDAAAMRAALAAVGAVSGRISPGRVCALGGIIFLTLSVGGVCAFAKGGKTVPGRFGLRLELGAAVFVKERFFPRPESSGIPGFRPGPAAGVLILLAGAAVYTASFCLSLRFFKKADSLPAPVDRRVSGNTMAEELERQRRQRRRKTGPQGEKQ